MSERVIFRIPKGKQWLLRSLQDRVNAYEVLGGKTTISKEVIKLLEDGLRAEHIAVYGTIQSDQPSYKHKQNKHTNLYRARLQELVLAVPDRFIELVSTIDTSVRLKREAGVPITLGEEILSLLDESIFEEKREIWLDNADKLGYSHTCARETLMKAERAESLGRTWFFNKRKQIHIDSIMAEADRVREVIIDSMGKKAGQAWHDGVRKAREDWIITEPKV